MLVLDMYENFLKGRRRSQAVAGGGLPRCMPTAIKWFDRRYALGTSFG